MERTVEVVPEAGLHARPASRVVQRANEFESDLSVGRLDTGDSGLVSADSLLSVTGLNVERGESVRIVADRHVAASRRPVGTSLSRSLSQRRAEGRR